MIQKFLLTSLMLFAILPMPAFAQAPSTPTEAAKTKFKVKKIRLGGKTIPVEIADSPELQEQGLMFRDKLADDHGMLFVFDEEKELRFWMKNTLIPLSIGYFDRDRKLVRTYEMVPAVAGEAMPRTYDSKLPAIYALEMPKDWFPHHKILPGAQFSFVEKN